MRAVNQTPKTHGLLLLWDLPALEPSPNAHVDSTILVGTPCGGCTLVFSGFVSLRMEGCEARAVRWLRASLGSGKRSELCAGGRRNAS